MVRAMRNNVMNTEQQRTGSMENLDPDTVAAYVAHYPSLRHVAANLPDLRAVRTFAQNACRLEVPPGVSIRKVWELSKHCLPPS